MKISSLTIIDDDNVRGIIASRRILSKKMLEDIIDFVELSTPEAAIETARRIREADRKNSWIPAEKIERRFQRRVKNSERES